MAIQLAHEVGPSRITIAYERLGDPGDPPVLLIMGLGAQLVAWPDAFCAQLVARGLHVIRFDNRDAGQSTIMRDAPMPNFAAALAGDLSTASYSLSDMAADAAGLLDVLGIARAHVVGASLGGFVAQMLAIEHPARVRTLTSIMSNTGARDVGQPHPTAMQIFAGPIPTTRAQAMERARSSAAIIGSTGFPLDLDATAARAGLAFDRAGGFDPLVSLRQGLATIATGDRTARLQQLAVPTLVIHGTADLLVDPSGGRATAAAIPDAKLVMIEGLGHDLPAGAWPTIVDAIATHVRAGDER